MYSSIYLFLNIGGQEMIFIFVIALFLFGGKKLPELARGLGKGIREFKDASENIKRDINDQINDFEKAADRPSKSEQKLLSEETVSTEEENKAYASSTPLDQPDISHSDEYYQQSYNYQAPDDYLNQAEESSSSVGSTGDPGSKTS